METESRKVQRLGYSSLGVSLPKDWAKGFGITPGTTVVIVREDDGSLRIRTSEPLPSPAGSMECVLDADACSKPGTLRRLLVAAYVVGRNSIRVKSRSGLSPEHVREVHDATRSLTGLTVVNQGPKFVLLENFAEPTRFPVDGLLRRLHFLTTRMAHLSLQPL
ncbi:MAG: AbrB/MazE/SpoVT family DNA-binding domain-containing protein, partial [Candidatus Thermoplasmatota archaeon]